MSRYFNVELALETIINAENVDVIQEEIGGLRTYIEDLCELIDELKMSNMNLECEISELNSRVSELEEGS